MGKVNFQGKVVDPETAWSDWFTTSAFSVDKRLRHIFQMLPHDPRCKFCNAPFQGIGGVVVHAGVAYFGAMGTAEGLTNISAIGEEVNTAARLASKAATGEIIVSERALQAAGIDGHNLESRSLELKGISSPVPVRVMRAA